MNKIKKKHKLTLEEEQDNGSFHNSIRKFGPYLAYCTFEIIAFILSSDN